MQISNTKQWLIVSKDRKVVAKGTPRNRELCIICGIDKKRYLTYSSKKMAESAFTNHFFSQHKIGTKYTKDDLEAVEATLTLNII